MSLYHEYSAGGVVFRRNKGSVEVAVIKPKDRQVLALPKGHIEKDETPVQSAAREVFEETGLKVTQVHKLGDVEYAYSFHGRKTLKKVEFFLFEHISGEIDQITLAMREEVDLAQWMPIEIALKRLTFPGEREMMERAEKWIAAQSVKAI